jgi:hypothetical protein
MVKAILSDSANGKIHLGIIFHLLLRKYGPKIA